MIVRWGLASLPEVLGELGSERPLLITSARWRDAELPVERRFDGVRPHTEADSVRAATAAAEDADGLVALGGGSAIDTAKAVSAERGLPIVSIPTTYRAPSGRRSSASGTRPRASSAAAWARARRGSSTTRS